MGTRTVDRIEDWESRPFSGGYRGIHDLADERFSGVVVSGLARLCLLNGNVVGVVDGDIEDFEDADGTAYEAPSPALPLLATMQERTDEVRAKYYTEDTPLEEVDQTLESGGFTGFVVLSENVLSGDYYLVYHQGRSMAVAFVGESQRLLTDDEAFDRAADEVGIYEVRPVPVEVIDVPEPEPDSDAAAAAGGATAGTAGEAAEAAGADDSAEPVAGADDDADAQSTDADTAAEPEAESDAGPATEADATVEADAASEADAESDAESADDTRADSGTGPAEVDARDAEPPSTAEPDSAGAEAESSAAEAVPDEEPTTATDDGTGTAGGTAAPAAGASQSRGRRDTDSTPSGAAAAGASLDEAAGGLERRTIPSLDPERTSTAENESTSGSGSGSQAAQRTQRRDAPASRSTNESAQQQSAERQASTADQQGGESLSAERTEADAAATDDSVAELEAELAERSEELSELRARAERLQTERDDLQAERDELEARVEELEAEIARLQSQSPPADASGSAGGRSITPAEAIDGTNLFVRYQSKGESTLESAHGGAAGREEVNSNLRIEYHTQFEDGDVTVGEDSFDTFLEDAIEYRFVAWTVRELLFEIRDTGHESALADLFDALPAVDRADLQGTVSVQYEEDGETHRAQEDFDVVLRDRMGNPLVVADINDARDAATQGMMESLVTRATRVGESNEQLAGAFLVTSSFFEPAALETASEATSGGLLSRDKRESFVKLSRKQGYHLCLVEARNRKFHMAVPEL